MRRNTNIYIKLGSENSGCSWIETLDTQRADGFLSTDTVRCPAYVHNDPDKGQKNPMSAASWTHMMRSSNNRCQCPNDDLCHQSTKPAASSATCVEIYWGSWRWSRPPRMSIFGGDVGRTLTPVSVGAICSHGKKPSCHTGHLQLLPTGITLPQLFTIHSPGSHRSGRRALQHSGVTRLWEGQNYVADVSQRTEGSGARPLFFIFRLFAHIWS